MNDQLLAVETSMRNHKAKRRITCLRATVNHIVYKYKNIV